MIFNGTVAKKGFILLEILFGLVLLSFFLLQMLHLKRQLITINSKIEKKWHSLQHTRNKLFIAMSSSLNYVITNPIYKVKHEHPYYKVYLRDDSLLKNLYILKKP